MKKTRRSNYHVVVYTPEPVFMRNTDHDEMMRRSRALAEQVDRHCDGEGKAEIHFDTEHYCEHCGYSWELDEDGVPTCCDEAQKEHDAEAAA